jgi:Glycosyl hydrolase family 47
MISGVFKVNLRYGVKHELSRTGEEKDTCTACAGSMLLEFSALSRLTGERVFEVSIANPSEAFQCYSLEFWWHHAYSISSWIPVALHSVYDICLHVQALFKKNG